MRDPRWRERTYAERPGHHPALPPAPVSPDKLPDPAAEREPLEHLVENDGDEKRHPLRAAAGAQRDANHDRVKDDTGLQDGHIGVGLRRRVVGVHEPRGTMAVAEVGRPLLVFVFVERRGTALATRLQPAHDAEVDAEDEVAARRGGRRGSVLFKREEGGVASTDVPAVRRVKCVSSSRHRVVCTAVKKANEGEDAPIAIAAAAGSKASSPKQVLPNMMNA